MRRRLPILLATGAILLSASGWVARAAAPAPAPSPAPRRMPASVPVPPSVPVSASAPAPITTAISAPIAAPATIPTRIASLNLCADQYLLALADPGQILGLTRLARDPGMSAAADRARALPVIGSSAELLLARAPDLVLTGWAGQADAARRAGLAATIVAVPPANSFADIVAQIRLVARAIGHPARGEALVARLQRDLATIVPRGHGRVAADYQRRGFLTGGGTLMDEMMRRVGLRNLATRLGRPALSNLSLEQMVAARPDFLIVARRAPPRDLGSAMLDHPALRSIPRLVMPPALTTCGGPSFARAVRILADQVAAATKARDTTRTAVTSKPPRGAPSARAQGS